MVDCICATQPKAASPCCSGGVANIQAPKLVPREEIRVGDIVVTICDYCLRERVCTISTKNDTNYAICKDCGT